MEIIRTNVDTSAKALMYKLTRSSGCMVQDVADGTSVKVRAYCLYNDVKLGRDGSQRENIVLSFIDEAGKKYSTISATFIREFTYILDLMGNEPFSVLIVHGTTNGGKNFVTCELDCSAE